MTQTAIPCVVMRGGTSRGLYFRAEDLPGDPATRNRGLLAAMGSPDRRQIDGMGGAHPLTSKVAIVGPPSRGDADVDYLFLQVALDAPEVLGNQNCGNLLAAIGPFAVEQGIVRGTSPETRVRIHMVNSGGIAVANVQTPGGEVTYDGNTRIDGVPGTAAPITLEFLDVAGNNCGALLPTGAACDHVQGTDVTCIDNGMPVVILRAADFGKSGYESPEQLESDSGLCERIEALRLALGPRMNLGDVAGKTVPKLCLVAAPRSGGVIATRTFIPRRVHESIGVLGAASVAAACLLPGSTAHSVSQRPLAAGRHRLDVEHPTGSLSLEIDLDLSGDSVHVPRSALVRTARKLMQGTVFVPASVWSGT